MDVYSRAPQRWGRGAAFILAWEQHANHVLLPNPPCCLMADSKKWVKALIWVLNNFRETPNPTHSARSSSRGSSECPKQLHGFCASCSRTMSQNWSEWRSFQGHTLPSLINFFCGPPSGKGHNQNKHATSEWVLSAELYLEKGEDQVFLQGIHHYGQHWPPHHTILLPALRVKILI